MTVGERIKYYRELKSMSQDELSRRLGLKDRSSVSKIEKAGDDISTKSILKYAKALSVTPSQLMGWEDTLEDIDSGEVSLDMDDSDPKTSPDYQVKSPNINISIELAQRNSNLDLYKNIRKRRNELHLTQDELAKRTGYSGKSIIAMIEAGKIDLSLTKIMAFAEALNTTPEELMRKNDMQKETDDETLLYRTQQNAKRMSESDLRAMHYYLLYLMAMKKMDARVPIDFYSEDADEQIYEAIKAQRKIDLPKELLEEFKKAYEWKYDFKDKENS